MSTEMKENYLEYNFLAAQYRDLMNVRGSILEGLKKDPQHVNLMINKKNIESDIYSVGLMIQSVSSELLKNLQDKYNMKFKFLLNHGTKKENIVKTLKTSK